MQYIILNYYLLYGSWLKDNENRLFVPLLSPNTQKIGKDKCPSTMYKGLLNLFIFESVPYRRQISHGQILGYLEALLGYKCLSFCSLCLYIDNYIFYG